MSKIEVDVCEGVYVTKDLGRYFIVELGTSNGEVAARVTSHDTNENEVTKVVELFKDSYALDLFANLISNSEYLGEL